VADKQRIACDPNGRLVRTLGATAYACYPLKASDGRLLGTFAVASATRESFADDEAAFDTSSAVRLRSPPSTIPDRIMSRLFSATFTTKTFDPSSLRWLETNT
jgi:hypothetical protein